MEDPATVKPLRLPSGTGTWCWEGLPLSFLLEAGPRWRPDGGREGWTQGRGPSPRQQLWKGGSRPTSDLQGPGQPPETPRGESVAAAQWTSRGLNAFRTTGGGLLLDSGGRTASGQSSQGALLSGVR